MPVKLLNLHNLAFLINQQFFFLKIALLIRLGFFTDLRGLYLEGLIHGVGGGGRVIFAILQYLGPSCSGLSECNVIQYLQISCS